MHSLNLGFLHNHHHHHHSLYLNILQLEDSKVWCSAISMTIVLGWRTHRRVAANLGAVHILCQLKMGVWTPLPHLSAKNQKLVEYKTMNRKEER